MLIELLIIGIVAGFVSLLCAFIAGFVGVFLGFRIITPYVPGMIWKAINGKDKSGKSMIDLLWASFQGRINGLGGGRPKKGAPAEIGGGMSKMMEWMQMLQALQAMNTKKQNVPTPENK